MERSNQDGRWTGRQGEKTFDLQCSLQHITCNRANEDDNGWDFFIQFPDRLSTPFLADETSSALCALVQVKTTKGPIKNWSISLQNALNLVRSPLPVFIVVYAIDADNESKAFGIHLWNAEIARVLFAVRQAEVEGSTRLNHRSITFPFGETNQRSDVLGWIRSEIEAAGNDYASQKVRLRETIGYEPARDVIRLDARDLTEERFLDLQLGLVDGIDADLVTITSRRFGIEARRPRLSFEGVRFRFVSVPTRGRLRLQASDGDTFFVPAEIFYAESGSSRRHKVRVLAGCLELVCDDKGRIVVDAHLPYDKIVPLDDIEAFGFLQSQGDRKNVYLQLDTLAGPTDLGLLRVYSTATDRISWAQMRYNIAALRAIAAYAGTLVIETSVGALARVLGPLIALDALTCRRSMTIEIMPFVDGDTAYSEHLAYGSVLIDGHVIGAVARRPILSDQSAGAKRSIYLGPAKIIAAIHGGDATQLRRAYMEELDRLSEHHTVFATGDMMNVLSGSAKGFPLIIDEPRNRGEILDPAERQGIAE